MQGHRWKDLGRAVAVRRAGGADRAPTGRRRDGERRARRRSRTASHLAGSPRRAPGLARSSPAANALAARAPAAAMIRVAAVDLGTNSTRLLIADVEGERLSEIEEATHDHEAGRGRRQPAAPPLPIARVRNCLSDYRREIESRGIDRTLAIATSAVRDAENGEAFLGEIEWSYGFATRLLDGAAEAAMMALGRGRGGRARRHPARGHRRRLDRAGHMRARRGPARRAWTSDACASPSASSYRTRRHGGARGGGRGGEGAPPRLERDKRDRGRRHDPRRSPRSISASRVRPRAHARSPHRAAAASRSSSTGSRA